MLNTKLLGISIDSLHSHLAWARNIEEIDLDGNGAVKVAFPIIADISMRVAKKFGMLQTVANTQTVRAVFIIDPEGVIRTILYYPMSTGRNLLYSGLLRRSRNPKEERMTPRWTTRSGICHTKYNQKAPSGAFLCVVPLFLYNILFFLCILATIY